MPTFNSYAPFSDNPVTDPEAGTASAQWNANYGRYFSFTNMPKLTYPLGMYWVACTVLMFFYWLCSLRTNVVYALMFTTIFPAVGCIAAVFLHAAAGNTSAAHNCTVVSVPDLRQ